MVQFSGFFTSSPQDPVPVARPLCCALAAVLVLGLVALAAPSTHAQTPEPPSRTADSTQTQRFRLADAYMRAGQFDRAIPLLEDLHAEDPGNPSFYNKLKDAYESVKRYDDAIALVEKRMDGSPSPIRMSEKARLQYLKGIEEEAFATWDRAIALAPERASSYRIVYQALVNIRRFDQAIEILKRGRNTLGDDSAFRIELAYLYSLNGEPTPAMQEYVDLLEDNPGRASFVRSRLSAFVEQDEGLEASIKVLNDAVRDEPLNRGYRELLAWLYMENDDYAAALDVHRAIDRLENENGRVLFGFARQAADADAYEVASEAYRLILERHPDSPVAPDAQKGLGDMHRRWAEQIGERAVAPDGSRRSPTHYDSAATAYRAFLDTYPTHNAVPTVLRTLGRLQQDVFRNLSAADSTLQQVVARYPDSEAADEARYDRGRIALLRGNLNEARLAFSRLVDRLRTGDLAELARYEMALLDFYEGAFESALARVQATNRNTSADVANDAIELKVLLAQNKGPDSLNTPLTLFATARLQARQHRYDDALGTLDSLLTAYGRHSLSDEARFNRAQYLEQLGRTEAAASAFGEIPLMHPRSPYADRSLFQLGRLREDAGNREAALEAYNRLLESYPRSLLAADTRARLRTLLRGDGA